MHFIFRNLSISSRLSDLLAHKLFIIFSSDPLYFCGINHNVSSFILDFESFFFLISLAKGLSILFIFSENKLLVH